jgi:hypothetical protein
MPGVLIIREGPSAPPDVDMLKEATGLDISINSISEVLMVYDCTNPMVKDAVNTANVVIRVGTCQLGDVDEEKVRDIPPENAVEMIAEMLKSQESSGSEETENKPVD